MITFIPNPKGILELREECDYTEIAEAVAEEARNIAPVGTGAYRDSIHVEDGHYVVAGGRTASRIVFYAWMLEFGTVDTPAYATLTTAAIHSGLDLSQISVGQIAT